MVEMVETVIHDRWTLKLPAHRAERSETWGSWWPIWEKPRVDSMWNNLNPGDVVYDIGAEMGDWPALWASWGCQVMLAEANPLSWPNIRATFEANGLTDRVVGTWPGFVAGPEDDPDRFYNDNQQWPAWAHRYIVGATGTADLHEMENDLVVRTTIDSIANELVAPDAITIDVEGSELHVLHGAKGVLREQRPLVWVSIHPYFMLDNYGQTPDDLLAFMDGCGYVREHLAAEHEWHTLFYPEERIGVQLPYGGKS